MTARPPALPTGPEKVRAVRAMFDAIAPRYDLVNRVMTFGMDVGWRRKTLTALRLPRGALVADLACGTADLCREAEAAGLRAIGFDLSLGMLARAKTAAPLVQADVLSLPLRDACVDGATCGFALRNVTDVGLLFAETARVVRPGGRVAFLETAEPSSAIVRAGHAVYFRRIVPFVGGLLSSREAYRYLPRSTAYLPPVQELLSRLERAGFTAVRRLALGLGAVQLITATRR